VLLTLPAVTLPFVRDAKWKKKWALFEPQASFARFPFCVTHKREPVGQRLAVAFLCLLSLAKQRKKVAAGPPRQLSINEEIKH
jgi:hypothetical protein